MTILPLTPNSAQTRNSGSLSNSLLNQKKSSSTSPSSNRILNPNQNPVESTPQSERTKIENLINNALQRQSEDSHDINISNDDGENNVEMKQEQIDININVVGESHLNGETLNRAERREEEIEIRSREIERERTETEYATQRANELEIEEEEEHEIEEDRTRTFEFNIDEIEIEQDVDLDNINDRVARLNTHLNHIDYDEESLGSEYILSKLYNYMKISEMDKYGITVFETTFKSYLKYLKESDFIKLATSYWCNGTHFKCMISHRGSIINQIDNDYIHNNNGILDDEDVEFYHSSYSNNDNNNQLQLKVTTHLLDTAMQSGACADKIDAMLKQKRIDDGIKYKNNNNNKKKTFYHTLTEKNFYLRNLKHRFWNHEVLVRVFIRNGWLNKSLSQIAINKFIHCIYERTLQSKLFCNNSYSQQSFNYSSKIKGNIVFSKDFLNSFFSSYYSLDSIPPIYEHLINNNQDNKNINNKITEETLNRWCELIELLSSRGAILKNKNKFNEILPLKYAYKLGSNTYWIKNSNHSKKNKLLIDTINVSFPDDMWNTITSYL